MVKNKTQKRIFIAISTCVMILCCTLCAISYIPNVKAATLSDNGAISQIYALGETFVAPEAKIAHDGNEYDATVVSVKYPNGKAYNTSSYVLSVPGEYVITYSATVGAKTVFATKKFVVSGSAYSISGSNSSVKYGEIENTDALGVPTGTTTEGLKVSLVAGDKFTYNKPINLNGKTKDDKLIELFVTPKNLGKADARILRLRLTDVYDSNNYVDVVTYGNYGDEDEVKGWALYSAAGANGQALTGIHYKAPGENVSSAINYLGDKYTVNPNITYNSANGYPTREFSFVAKQGYGTGIYSMAMDYAERRVYGPKAFSDLANGIIVDLDEPLFYSNLWEGFTTGEVFLSIWADNYVNASFDFIIKSIGGQSLENPHFIDKDAPRIAIETPKNGIPFAVLNTPYKIFDAQANDAVDGKVDVQVSVYRNYYSSNSTLMNIENGAFTPKDLTDYTIVYRAVDRSGSVAVEKIDVTVKAESDLTIEFVGGQTKAKAGMLCALKNPVVTGNDGNYKITVNVIGENTQVSVLANADGEYKFIPMKSGTYDVEYVCKDYNVEISQSYQLTIENNPDPVFVNDLYLPLVYVKNVEYTLPTFSGMDFSLETPQEKEAQISYAFDDGQFNLYTKGQKVKIDAEEKLLLKYSLGLADCSNVIYTVPVASVSGEVNGSQKTFITANYFYGRTFEKSFDKNGGYYSTTENNDKLIFVNKLLVSDFAINFAIKQMSCDKVVITLTDSVNKDQFLSVCLKYIDDNSYGFSINGGKEQIISGSIVGEVLSLEYNAKLGELKFGSITHKINNFSGFDSKLAWLDFEVVDNEGKTEIQVTNVNGQSISNSSSDYQAPVYNLVINSDQKIVGEYIIISEFTVADVIRFETTKSITVRDVNGEICRSVDGVYMENVSDFSREYKIEVKEEGKYEVEYQVTDCAIGFGGDTISILVVDGVKPTITLGGAVKTAKVGANVAVASYVAKDSTDKKLFASVCVQRPDMKVVNVKGSFKADIAGTYTVMYLVTDDSGNSAFLSYDVVVK